MKASIDTIVFSILILIIIGVCAWNIGFQISEYDPAIERKYDKAAAELRQIENLVIAYYCKNRKFPAALDDLLSKEQKELTRDPWGHPYVIKSLDWRRPGSGRDLLSTGSDGKTGGKAWKSDIVLRINIKDIRCE